MCAIVLFRVLLFTSIGPSSDVLGVFGCCGLLWIKHVECLVSLLLLLLLAELMCVDRFMLYTEPSHS
jgi:hypothetical protein